MSETELKQGSANVAELDGEDECSAEDSPFTELNKMYKPQEIRQDPLQYMLDVMRDPLASPARRDKMAIAAAPYLHKRGEEIKEIEDCALKDCVGRMTREEVDYLENLLQRTASEVLRERKKWNR